jgi:Flp pilus assembly protein TadG
MRTGRRAGQGLTEFALVLPVLLLLLFGVVDFGRAIYYYIGASEAVAESVRWATLSSTGNPSNADVLAAATPQAPYLTLAPCPNGLLSGSITGPGSPEPSPGVGWLYVTAPPGGNAADGANAPGGETGTETPPCATSVPATVGDRLQVTVVYNFQPITPLIQNIVGGRILLSSSSIFTVER